jgi:segregation and condensation protein B
MKGSLKASLEALLFASNHPLSLEDAAAALNIDKKAIKEELKRLAEDYGAQERGVHLAEVAGGWQILTRPEQARYVEKLLIGRRRARLSRAALETLAAVAYNQPITKGEIDTLRGVDSSGALHTVLERDLVAVKGKSDRVGRPLIYGTTAAFLEYFGLPSIKELPQLEDFAALVDREAVEEEAGSAAGAGAADADSESGADAAVEDGEEKAGEMSSNDPSGSGGVEPVEEGRGTGAEAERPPSAVEIPESPPPAS